MLPLCLVAARVRVSGRRIAIIPCVSDRFGGLDGDHGGRHEPWASPIMELRT